jgi:hypothetical protein
MPCGGTHLVSDLSRDRVYWTACKRSGSTGAAILLVLILSFAAVSACKQADPNFNPYRGINFDGDR